MNFVGNFVGNFVERVVAQGNECSVEIAQGNPVRGGIVGKRGFADAVLLTAS